MYHIGRARVSRGRLIVGIGDSGIRHRHPIRELIDPGPRKGQGGSGGRREAEGGRKGELEARRGRRRAPGRRDRWASTGSPNWSIGPVMVGGRWVSSDARHRVRTWLPLPEHSFHASSHGSSPRPPSPRRPLRLSRAPPRPSQLLFSASRS